MAGGKQCICPPGYEGDAYTTGCSDVDECARSPCGKNAVCTNLEGSFSCTCSPGFVGDPSISCTGILNRQQAAVQHIHTYVYVYSIYIYLCIYGSRSVYRNITSEDWFSLTLYKNYECLDFIRYNK